MGAFSAIQSGLEKNRATHVFGDEDEKKEEEYSSDG